MTATNTKLSQILAIEKGAKGNGDRKLTLAYHTVQKAALLNGISRTYRPRNDEDGEQLPSEQTLVQVRVEALLADVSLALVRMFDVAATKDYTNCDAKADVVVDGETLLTQAPVTYLLYLEKQLTDMTTFMRKLPTLDPAESWTYDEATSTWRTATITTTRTKKIPRNHVLAAATDKHPAQVQMYMEDVVVGFWNTVKFSGALPTERVHTILGRIQRLQEAVKMAREQANSVTVQDVEVGKKIFDFLLRH